MAFLDIVRLVLGHKDLTPVTIEVAKIDDDHFKVTTSRGNEKHETIATVFTEEEVKNVERAQKNVSESLLLSHTE